MHINQDIYKHLLERHSIRRYEPDLLGENELLKIRKASKVIDSLDRENIFELKIFEYQPETSEGKALGGFGRIMKPPYFFAPFITGGTNSLIDLGFRTQQLVLDMWNNGIGSCYVGCAHRQNRVKQLLNISDQARIISFVIFGQPAAKQTLRFYQKISQFFTKSKKRFSFQELFLDYQYPEKIKRNSLLKKVLEAGRFAPSATNSQPWRFESKDGRFTIFAHQKKIANLYDLKQGYSFHDTGICMANMSNAAVAFGKKIRWHWANKDDNMQQLIETNIPVAYFSLDDLRS